MESDKQTVVQLLEPKPLPADITYSGVDTMTLIVPEEDNSLFEMTEIASNLNVQKTSDTTESFDLIIPNLAELEAEITSWKSEIGTNVFFYQMIYF